MRLFCKCGCQLMIHHEIILDVRSNFTCLDGIITLTKHHLLNTKGIKPSIKEEDVTLFCRECNKDVDVEDAHIQCDNCGSHTIKEDSKKFGNTIRLCPRCINSCKSFETFKLFGARGPSAQTRQSRINEALRNAQEINPELPQEVIDLFEGEDSEASNSDRPFEATTPQEYTISNAVAQIDSEGNVVRVTTNNEDREPSIRAFDTSRWRTSTGTINTGDE